MPLEFSEPQNIGQPGYEAAYVYEKLFLGLEPNKFREILLPGSNGHPTTNKDLIAAFNETLTVLENDLEHYWPRPRLVGIMNVAEAQKYAETDKNVQLGLTQLYCPVRLYSSATIPDKKAYVYMTYPTKNGLEIINTRRAADGKPIFEAS